MSYTFPTNYTITDVTYNNVTAGLNVSDLHPTAVLVLTPDTGYVLDATMFSIEGALPMGVSSVVFTQSDANVLCTATFSNSLVMPSADLEIALCINGMGTLAQYHIAGQIDPLGPYTNFVIDPSSLYTFDEVGEYGSDMFIYDITLVANAGYYFPTIPVLAQTSGDSSIFNITTTNYNDTYGNLVECVISVQCTVPNNDSFDNNFVIRAEVNEIYSPSILVTDYLMDRSYIPMIGDIRTLTLIGVEGSSWHLISSAAILQSSEVDPVTKAYILLDELRGTIDSSGMAEIIVMLPAETDYTEYSILLSGDIKDPFPSLNPILLEQIKDVDISISISGTDVFIFDPSDTALTRTYSAMSVPPTGVDIAEGTIKWSITSLTARPITLLRQPLTTDISNWNEIAKTVTGAPGDSILRLDSIGELFAGMALVQPLQHTFNHIESINSFDNTVTLQYPVSIPDGTPVLFSYNKSNSLRFTLFAEQIDRYQIDVTVNLNIDQFGWGNQEFTLDPTNFIDY